MTLQTLMDTYAAEDLQDLTKAIYDKTESGVTIRYKLKDKIILAPNNPNELKAINPNKVTAIGISAIVEGTSAEVPETWIKTDEPNFIQLFNQTVEEVNDQATEIWLEMMGVEDQEEEIID